MKKKSLYTLLCTSILAQGISFAADNEQSTPPSTPNSKTSQLRQQLTQLPDTPALQKQAEKKVDPNITSPDSRNFMVNLETSRLRDERAKTAQEIGQSIATLTLNQSLEEARKTERTKGEERLATITEQLKSMTENKDQLSAEIHGLKNDLSAAKAEVEKAQSQAQAEKNLKKDILGAAQKRFAELQEKLDKKTQEEADLNNRVSSLTVQLEQLKTRDIYSEKIIGMLSDTTSKADLSTPASTKAPVVIDQPIATPSSSSTLASTAPTVGSAPIEGSSITTTNPTASKKMPPKANFGGNR